MERRTQKETRRRDSLWDDEERGAGRKSIHEERRIDSERETRRAKERRVSISPPLLLLLPLTILFLFFATLSTLLDCASLVEQIGTNDRRKAVEAEFIYAFPPQGFA